MPTTLAPYGKELRVRGVILSDHPVDLYDNAYTHFANSTEAAVRKRTYGEDIGQSSWMTVEEWLNFADQLEITNRSHVLEVGSGSGGPATQCVTSSRGWPYFGSGTECFVPAVT